MILLGFGGSEFMWGRYRVQNAISLDKMGITTLKIRYVVACNVLFCDMLISLEISHTDFNELAFCDVFIAALFHQNVAPSYSQARQKVWTPSRGP